MEYDIDYSRLPEHIREGMRRYIEEGCPPGRFLQHVIKNKLVDSFGLADPTNKVRMHDICSFMYNQAPLPCWGNATRYNEWIKKGGLKGR